MKKTINGFIFAKKASRYDLTEHAYVEEILFDFATWDRTEYDRDLVKVAPHSFEIEVSEDFDIRPGLVENLEREKKKVMAEFQARITEIDGQINKHLAIENAAEIRDVHTG